MFDFLDSDWFIISLEIVCLILIAYDIKKYIETKKKEYITNIVLTSIKFLPGRHDTMAKTKYDISRYCESYEITTILA